jgi:hypothetical protein
MNKETAIVLNAHGVNAIREMHSALVASQNRCSEEEIALIKRSVGEIIAKIDTFLLDAIYAKFPDLDHLQGR